ncbi:coagulation factor XIII A chain [Boleophthalmus pectinirostris]|uniref:coagulation factor XIII A chain n=1 Tax=Boleophthalmus pectinirostris TaxID=150288 RepID=UPI002432A750|nr:coagulation factor XIII A chain [Boleophthalmus pectinirostris]
MDHKFKVKRASSVTGAPPPPQSRPVTGHCRRGNTPGLKVTLWNISVALTRLEVTVAPRTSPKTPDQTPQKQEPPQSLRPGADPTRTGLRSGPGLDHIPDPSAPPRNKTPRRIMSRHVHHRGRFSKTDDVVNLVDKDSEVFPQFEAFDGVDVTPRSSSGSPLSVQDVDLMKSMNASAHRTAAYQTEALVIRRGDPFFLKLTFNRPIRDQDSFQVQFRIGANPNELRKSLVVVSFSGLVGSGPWAASASEQQGALMLQITPSTDAVVGRYRVAVGVALANGLQFTGPELQPYLYLLFNAFNPGDSAFLKAGHEEYVLNDSGEIYIGSMNQEYAKNWNYGQYEAGVLEACIFIMDKSQLPIADRGDAVKVVRMASAMINSQDDDGVLVGNWSDDFSLGKSPMFWTGSVQILLQFHNTGAPVAYAQCWVYAGVLNTFLRCLGFASRVITNFSSAHDNDGNLKTDLIFTSDLQPDSRRTRDSIWNYHCWNEVFLKRSDIPDEYSGWQVIDATPQETSDGHYRCGPASVLAIKKGKVCYPFDARFIFAEVNSDILYHIRDKYGNLSLLKVDKKTVGKKLLTKSPQGYQPLELTWEYKHNEDTPEGERRNEEALATAESLGCSRDHTETPPTSLSVTINTKKSYVGRPVEALVDFVNQSDSSLQTQVTVSVETIYYTGVRSQEVHKEDYPLVLPPRSTQQMALSVSPHEYLPVLGQQPNLKISVSVRAPPNVMVTESAVVSLEVLWLQLQVSSPVRLGQKGVVSVSFTNKLDIALSRPALGLEGPGLLPFRTKEFEVVEPGGVLKWDVEFFPYGLGLKKLSSVLIVNDSAMAWGFVDVEVLPPPHWSSYGSAPFGVPRLMRSSRSGDGA